MGKGKFAWWGPYWRQGTFLNRRYIKGFAKLDARYISRINDREMRARVAVARYALYARFFAGVNQQWFYRLCNVEVEEGA